MSDAQSNIEAGPSVGNSPGVRQIDSGFVRNMKIIGGFLLVVIVVVVFMFIKAFSGGKESSAPANKQVVLDTGLSQRQVKSKDDAIQTPAMQRMLEERQVADADQARREGRSYVPTEAIGALEPVRAAPMPDSTMRMAVNNVNQSTNSDQQQAQAIRDGLRNQLAAIIPASMSQGAPRQSLSVKNDRDDQSKTSAAAGQIDVQQRGAPAAGALTAANAATLIAPLEIMTGKLANPITALKGRPSYASALITTGAFKGSFLIGTSTLNDNETIETVFTMMRFGRKAYKIDAIVLDEQTADAGVKGEIDRRILERYVLPISVAAAQGYFTAGANPGTTVLTGATGVNGTVTPPSSDDQARKAGMAAGLGILGKDVQKGAEEPIRSSVERDMAIGILFRAAVKDELK